MCSGFNDVTLKLVYFILCGLYGIEGILCASYFLFPVQKVITLLEKI